MLFLLSFKVFWRELKSGQLSVMFIALLLAVTSVSCISIFTDRLQKALLLETQEFLGGDLKYESNEKLLPSVLKEINYDIFVKSEVTSFASMISAADNMQLSSVKAVDSFYPLIGHVELEDESSQGKQYLESPPPRNHVWIDKRLKELLEVEIGDFIEIGNANFIVSHTLISEPDRGSSSFAFAPKAIINVEEFYSATSQLAQTTLRSVLGQHELDDMLSERETLNTHIQKIIDEATDVWGIKVTNVELKDIDLDESTIRVIAKQAEAERNRRAKVIHAEGELQASEKLLAAAQTLSKEPQALQLRYLQTLNSIADEKNSTIIFPLPIEFMLPFKDALKKFMGPEKN